MSGLIIVFGVCRGVPLGILIVMVAGYLLLPVRMAINFPMVPPLTKHGIPVLAVLVIAALMASRNKGIYQRPGLLPKSWLARGLMEVFFARVEVAGEDLVPPDKGVLAVANHGNSLVDGLLLLAYLPRTPRFLAASTLWDRPVLRPFLAAAGWITMLYGEAIKDAYIGTFF